MNQRRRRLLHGRIAGAFEQRQGTPPSVLAWHWYHAEHFDRAFPLALAAAEEALAAGDQADAMIYLSLAEETAADPATRAAAARLRESIRGANPGPP